MERGARCLIPIESTDAAERTRYRTSPEFAPEPFSAPSAFIDFCTKRRL
jgi:hypothetical protein